MRAVLVADDGPSAGLGHRRRLEALAAALAALDVETTVVALDAYRPDGRGDIVVVDSYRARADDRGRFDARVVAAIDDLDRDLAVDVVVDPSPGADGSRHQRARRVLAGADYAIVDPALVAARATVGEPRPADRVRRVLVTLGASVSGAEVGALAAEIHRRLPAVEVHVACGPWLDGSAAGVTVIRAPHGLVDELVAADLVVTAGGVTMLEAVVLGRPTIAVQVAENQRRAVQTLAACGAVLAVALADAAAEAERLATDGDGRHRLAVAAGAAVDGLGAERVATTLVRMVAA